MVKDKVRMVNTADYFLGYDAGVLDNKLSVLDMEIDKHKAALELLERLVTQLKEKKEAKRDG